MQSNRTGRSFVPQPMRFNRRVPVLSDMIYYRPGTMDEKRLTPMLEQYRQIKARFPDALVLFRLGDFYETFETDAGIAARELELVLTARSFAKGVRLPMAG